MYYNDTQNRDKNTCRSMLPVNIIIFKYKITKFYQFVKFKQN